MALIVRLPYSSTLFMRLHISFTRYSPSRVVKLQFNFSLITCDTYLLLLPTSSTRRSAFKVGRVDFFRRLHDIDDLVQEYSFVFLAQSACFVA